MERPELNVARLLDTMEWIEANPQVFEPRVWGITLPSGTLLADFGGWAVMRCHPDQLPPLGGSDGHGGFDVAEHWMVNGEWMPSFAMRLLGITMNQRRVLFHGGATIAGLRAVVDELVRTGGAVEDAELARIARRAGARDPLAM
jgi:hypothetical protein